MGQFRQLRKTMRANRMRRGLEREREYYNHRFKELGLTLPDDQHIRETLTRRFPQFAAKVKNQLRILAVFHDYNWEKGAWLPALEQFGTVIHYDWGERFDQGDRAWFKSTRAQMNADLLQKIEFWHRQTPIDVIFCYLSGHQITAQTLQRMRAFQIPIVNVSFNDKEYFVGEVKPGRVIGMRDICRHFDLCWTSTKDALPKYAVEGALAVYLPEGANPDLHRPYDLSKEFDVSFVGQCYGQRPFYLGHLKKFGIEAAAFGSGWPKGPLSTEDMVKMYSRSKINLGFAAVSDMADTFCLKGRDFEVPMSGGLYLTQYHSELEPWYYPGQEIETFKDLDDLVQKIQYLLNHPEKAADIRQKGYRRAHREHTWQMRMNRIFSYFSNSDSSPVWC